MGFLGIGGSTTGAVVSGVTSFVSDYYENRDFTSAVINGAVSAGISLFWSAVDNIGPKQNQKGYLKYMRKDYHDANRRISNMNLSFAEALPLRRAVNEEKNEKNSKKKKIQQVNAKLNFVITTYYKGTGMEEVLKKLEQYLDSCDKNEHSITTI
mgnify:CR=1 FL=1